MFILRLEIMISQDSYLELDYTQIYINSFTPTLIQAQLELLLLLLREICQNSSLTVDHYDFSSSSITSSFP